MAERNAWRRLIAAVEHEYERRVRAASLVTQYGAAHPQHQDEPEGEVAAIANLPRGTRLGRARSEPTAHE